MIARRPRKTPFKYTNLRDNMRTTSLFLCLLFVAPAAYAQDADGATATEAPAVEAATPAAPAPEAAAPAETGETAEEAPAAPEAAEGEAAKVTLLGTTTEATEPEVEAAPEQSATEEAAPTITPDGVWSPFTDTRLTFTLADDNLLAGPGETDEPSPGTQFRGTNRNNLFFENYDTKDSGFETLSHVVLYKRSPSYFEGLYGEAALVLRLEVNPNDRRGGTRIADSSSYVRLVYQPEGWSEGENISFTGFPVTSDRFRLGYSYRLTWGGSKIFPQAGYSVPGARLQITRKNWYAWVGGKSTILSEQVELQAEQATELVANYGLLGGAGVDLSSNLRLEGGAGYFTKGTNANQAVFGEKIHAGGASIQAAWHVGRDVGTSIDLRLYRNDPQSQQRFFRPRTISDELAYVIKAEYTWLGQTLEDPASYGSTALQGASAGDINFALAQGALRVFADVEFRDLAYILFNVPSFVPFQAFSAEMNTSPETFAAVGLDYHIPRYHFTPGLRVGVQQPAAVTTERLPVGPNPGVELTGTRTVVVREEGEFDILPSGDAVSPIFAFQGTARLDISDSMAALGEVSFEVDNNRATFVQDVSGQNIATYENPLRLGFNVVLQARF